MSDSTFVVELPCNVGGKSIVHTVEIFALQLHKTGMQAKQGRQIVERHSGEDILHNEWTLFRMEVR